jgi:hypothetical protein
MERIIAAGDVRGGRDTKLVMARNRWFESISLQRRESANHRLLPVLFVQSLPCCGAGRYPLGQDEAFGLLYLLD